MWLAILAFALVTIGLVAIFGPWALAVMAGAGLALFLAVRETTATYENGRKVYWREQ